MDERLQLVLVDFDNLRGGQPRPLSKVWVPELAALNDPAAAVVAFAMNLESVDEHASFAELAIFAERIASSMARSALRGFEVALTLPIKEAADVVLERLLMKAPTSAHEGHVVAVHLLSEDKGLRRQIGDKLSKRYQTRDTRTAKSWLFDHDARGKGKPLKRRGPSPGMPSFGRGAPSDPHQAIMSRELIGQLGGRSVDIPEGASLVAIAEAAARRCGLLTQVGPTLQSLRGIERLRQIADGRHPTLSPCEPDEGLEVCADSPTAGEYTSPQPSTLGPGAVRFCSPPATIFTRLPLGALELASPPFHVAEGKLDDPRAVATLGPTALANADLVDVSIRGFASELRAEVVRLFGRPLSVWWWRTTGKTESKIRITGIDLPDVVPFSAKARVAHHRGELILAAPSETAQVTIERCESRILGTRSEDGLQVACLLPVGATPGKARYTRIQSCRKHNFQRLYPELSSYFDALCRLPLLVPG